MQNSQFGEILVKILKPFLSSGGQAPRTPMRRSSDKHFALSNLFAPDPCDTPGLGLKTPGEPKKLLYRKESNLGACTFPRNTSKYFPKNHENANFLIQNNTSTFVIVDKL